MAFYLTKDEGHEIVIFADIWPRSVAMSHKWLYKIEPSKTWNIGLSFCAFLS